MEILIIVLVVVSIIEIVCNPQQHKILLFLGAILFGIGRGAYKASGAEDKHNQKLNK